VAKSQGAAKGVELAGPVFQEIVVPTDFTDHSTKAVELALKLASHHGSRVTLLHVIETVPGLAFTELKPFYEKLRAKADKKMTALARQAAAPGVEVDADISYGSTADSIVKVATARHADLIVLASHRVNPSMVGRNWGTISYKVGILAQCPVLLVK
jgi:nucleotide-binding universal stress UspA family protein